MNGRTEGFMGIQPVWKEPEFFGLLLSSPLCPCIFHPVSSKQGRPQKRLPDDAGQARARRLDQLKPGSAPRWNRSCSELKRRFCRPSEEKNKTCTSSRRRQEEYLVFLPFFSKLCCKKKSSLIEQCVALLNLDESIICHVQPDESLSATNTKYVYILSSW